MVDPERAERLLKPGAALRPIGERSLPP